MTKLRGIWFAENIREYSPSWFILFFDECNGTSKQVWLRTCVSVSFEQQCDGLVGMISNGEILDIVEERKRPILPLYEDVLKPEECWNTSIKNYGHNCTKAMVLSPSSFSRFSVTEVLDIAKFKVIRGTLRELVGDG